MMMILHRIGHNGALASDFQRCQLRDASYKFSADEGGQNGWSNTGFNESILKFKLSVAVIATI